MQRLRFLVWKEFLELRTESAAVRRGRGRADHPADAARLCGDHRHPGCAGRGGRRRSHGTQPRADRRSFDASPNFSVVATVTTVAEIEPFLERGRAWLALSIPAGYGTALDSRAGTTIQVVADGTDSNSTTVALGYATSLIGGYAQELVAAGHAGVRRAAIDARIRVWYNPRLESRFFMIPGVLALVLLVVTANLASMAVVREKELGHAGAVERHAAPALGADRRQAAAVRADRDGRRAAGGRGRGGLVPDPAARQLAAAARDVGDLRLQHARARPVHLDDLGHPAAGDDDVDVLLSHADALSVRLHLPDREHARAISSR